MAMTKEQALALASARLRLKQQQEQPEAAPDPSVGEIELRPFGVSTGTGIKTGGINVTSVGNACNTSDIYLTPPDWYIESPSGIN